MLGDPHSRSAHRASPAGGLALLSPQALVRQAQAGQARARQAIVRQALARRTRAHQAIIRQALARRTQAHRATVRRSSAVITSPPDATADDMTAHHPPARGRQRVGSPAPGRPAPGLAPGRPAPDLAPGRPAPELALELPDVVRLAAEFHAGGRHLGVPSPVSQRRGTQWPGGLPRQRRSPQRGPQWPGGPAGQWRAPQRRAPQELQRTLQLLMRGLAALIVLAIVGLSGFFIVAEESRGQERDSVAAPGAEPGIASRSVDGEPLTQREVFPEPTIAGGYQVTMTHSDSECRIATIGELGALLRDHGCTQVVRARLTAPYGGYQVTTGIFNLADGSGAARVSELTGTLVETGRGTFATLGGSAGDPLVEPLAQVGWHNRGHYLLYCVIARPDGQLVTDDDPYATRITAELVEQYLGEQVVGGRTLDP